MSLKSKAKAAKARERVKEQRAAEEQKIANNAARLCALTSGFGRTKRKPKTEAKYAASKMPSYQMDSRKTVLHTEDRFTQAKAKPKQVLSPEMLARDQVAHERTREIQKRVDQAYNKGGLMLLSESEFQAMQRGELRRRS